MGVMVLCLATGVFAQGTLEKISKSGEFVVGVRDGAIPFGFISKDNEHVGFSVDMAKEFHKALEKELAKPIKFTLKTTNPKTRIPLVAKGTIDIECGSTTRWYILKKPHYRPDKIAAKNRYGFSTIRALPAYERLGEYHSGSYEG